MRDRLLRSFWGFARTLAAVALPVGLAASPARAATGDPSSSGGALDLLADPNVAFVLFVLGLGLILLELVNPTLLGGIVGGIALILSFIGFQGLPLNVVGLLLIAFGMLLFALETQITSHGVLALGGLVAFVLGASILYSPPSGTTPGQAVAVAMPLIIVTAAAFALLMVGVAYAAVRVRTMAPPEGTVGTQVPVGSEGVVQAPLNPLGTVYLGGETWSARTADGAELERDTPVRLVAFDGLVAVVAPLTATAPARP